MVKEKDELSLAFLFYMGFATHLEGDNPPKHVSKQTSGCKPDLQLVLFFAPEEFLHPSNKPIQRRTQQDCDQYKYKQEFIPSDCDHRLAGEHAEQ